MRSLITLSLLLSFSWLFAQDPIFEEQNILLSTQASNWGDIFIVQDINGDHKLDFFGVENDKHKLYLSNGGSFDKIDISDRDDIPVAFLDIDNDMDIDLITDEIAYYSNNGMNEFVATNFEMQKLANYYNIYHDFDNDGLIDIVSYNRQVFDDDYLLLDFKESGYGYQKVILDNAIPSYGYSKLADFDLDGDFDLMVINNGEDDISGERTKNILFFQNNQYRFLPKEIIEINSDLDINNTFLDVADLDNDGDMDILFSVIDDGMYLMEMHEGNFQSEVQINSKEIRFSKTIDIDYDGDLDLVFIEEDGGNIRLFYQLNNGDLQFGAPKQIGIVTGYISFWPTNPNTFENWFSLIDVDNDAVLDVVLNAPADQSIVWFENKTELIPTEITEQPQDADACEGEMVTISVEAIGSGLNYQWFKDNNPIEGANGNTFTISSTSTTDSGEYKCTVSGLAGSVDSETAHLNIKALASLDIQPSSETRIEGESVSFSIVADGTISNLQWYKDGAMLTESANITGTQSLELTLTNISLADEGIYSCKVSGDCNEIESSGAVLTVYRKTQIILHPVSVDICEDLTASFTVEAQGDNLMYQWTKDGSDIPSGVDPVLKIDGVQLSDAGAYECVVSGDGGTQSSESATLEVFEKVEITVQPEPVDLKTGETAVFTVVASGSNMAFRWYKDDVALSNEGDYSGAETDELSISDINMEDEGLYKCKITGECNEAFTEAVALSINTSVDNLTKFGIIIHPNPVKGKMNLVTNGVLIEGVQIFDQFGRLLVDQLSGVEQIDVSDLSSGIYYLKARHKGKIVVGMFMKM